MSYIGRQPVPQASRYIQEGTISTPTNEISVVGGYGVNNIHVYINGVLLSTDEYTANDGLKIVFDVPLPGGTKYLIEEFRTFEVAEFGTAWSETTTSIDKTLDTKEICLVTAAGKTVTLPANPSRGAEVIVCVEDFSDTIIERNGSTIMNNADNAVVNEPWSSAHLYYDGNTWRLI